MRLKLSILFFFIQFLSFGIPFKNEVFRKSVKTVFIENYGSDSDLPLIELNSTQRLTLHFDEISKSAKTFEYSFIKCTSEWEADEEVFQHDYIAPFFSFFNRSHNG